MNKLEVSRELAKIRSLIKECEKSLDAIGRELHYNYDDHKSHDTPQSYVEGCGYCQANKRFVEGLGGIIASEMDST